MDAILYCTGGIHFFLPEFFCYYSNLYILQQLLKSLQKKHSLSHSHNTSLHAQNIWKDINNVDGYNEGVTQVVFLGDFEKSEAAYKGETGKRYLNLLTGTAKSAITYQANLKLFYKYILGQKMNISDKDESLNGNPEYIEMPSYPKEGYCKMIGDKVVVKLQE